MLPKEIEIKYPSLEGFEGVFIYQDKKQKSRFYVITNDGTKTPFTSKEREKFELDLISNPIITADENAFMFFEE